jgi:hypothetical protein
MSSSRMENCKLIFLPVAVQSEHYYLRINLNKHPIYNYNITRDIPV